MDNKIKLFAVASIVAVMASGCSGYRASSQSASGSDDYSSSTTGGGSGQVSRGSQVSGSGQVSRGGGFGQRRPAATCSPCATNTQPKSTYTYKPAPKPTYQAPATKPYKPAPKQAGQHSQQWYVDRWKRQQAAGKQQPKQNTNYSGYGNTGNYTYDAAANNNTNYYDYSSAGKANTANTNVSTSNKSIYTGSYQQKTYKPYKPTTYSGGNTGTTNTTTYSAPAVSSGGGNTYTVKKGDTVFEIMRQTGVYWKDIIKMNNLQAPAYNINPGQIIRLK